MTLLPDLKNQVALVTGGGRGIGRAIALALAQCGATVVIAARTRAQLDSVVAEIGRAGAPGSGVALPMDVSDEHSIRDGFAEVRRTLGRLDILVNNAGIGRFGPTAEFAAADLDAVLGTNVRGTFLCCREALGLMLPAGRGYIINIASVVGFKGYPRQAAYTASKHAVMGLTKALAAELQGTPVRVSAVLPGGVDTDMAGDARPDLQRNQLLAPEDVARCVIYLLSLSDRAAIDQVYIRRKTSAPF